MNAKTIVHMIGQAHLDPVWLWRWTEGRAEALATSQSAVDRLAEYPDFHFVRGESLVYQWIEEENPALFAQILDYIRAGRWHVVNGMVIQPDMNIPQGESFVRQVLLGKAYMRDKLGVEPRIAYCVDSFGHTGQLPQILRQCGFDGYVFMRPGPHEKDLPASVFWWQAPDGSRILTFRITSAYTTRVVDHEAHIDLAIAAKPPQLHETLCFFGVGNHGGGPTQAQIENIQALAAERTDLELRFSWPDAYFGAVADQTADLPTVAEELQFHAVGCYSAISALKRSHRRAECGLLWAERLATTAQLWTGQPAPRARLHALWETLCFNQFHDTLGGSSIKAAEDDAIRALDGISAAADELINDAGRIIAAQIDTRNPAGNSGGNVVIFNPSAEAVAAYVEYEPWTDWQNWRAAGWGLVDAVGQPVPYQLIETHEALSSPRSSLNRLVFPVTIPPLGYRVYRFAANLPQPNVAGSAQATTTTLENDHWRIRFDVHSGAIVSCVAAVTGLELVGPEGWNLAQVLEDPSDTWSHGVRSFDQQIGTFNSARITVVDNGPLLASLLVERRCGAAIWHQQFVIRHGEPDVTIRNRLNWQGRWQMLKLAFDVATDQPQAAHDIAFGWCHRPNDGMEVPTQMWMDVGGPARNAAHTPIGVALINDGKYACDVRGSLMRLTILRCPPYAYHEPHTMGSKHLYDWIDQGEQEFTLVLRPHVGDWRDSGVVQAARALNFPLLPITTHIHAGALPAHAALLELTSPEMELSALKPAEDGDGYIVRIVDRHGRGGSGDLVWRGTRFSLTLAPFQITTWRVTAHGDGWQIAACDLLERPITAA